MSAPAASCCLHVGRPAVFALGPRGYCARCREGIAAARRAGTPGISQLDCAARFAGGDSWQAIPSPGAAHWLGHELGIGVAAGMPSCAAGRAARVSELLAGFRELARELPGPGDVWVDLDGEGCGVVIAALRHEDAAMISIRGGLALKPQVALLDFYRDCGGRGRFHRSRVFRP